MTFGEWQDRGWVTPHRPSRREIGDLLALAERDLKACRTPGLHPDWRLSIAHNAALQLATAALAASGHRATRDAYHAHVLASLVHTIGADTSLVRTLDTYRRKRNQSAYELAGIASETEADEMVALAYKLWDMVLAWIIDEHPDLAP
jgi:hypothetical protein